MTDDTIQAAINSLRADMMQRFSRVDNRLKEIADDITINFGFVDMARISSDGMRLEIQAIATEVAALKRKTRRLEDQIFNLTRPPGAGT